MARGTVSVSDDSKSNYIIVSESEAWLQESIPNNFCNSDFMRIILFYVLHSPCKKGSYAKVSLEKYGWKNPWYKDSFKELLNSKANFTDKTFRHCDSQKTFKQLWDSTGIQNDFYNLVGSEFAFVTYTGESNPYLDLLHHIRNAFAHGRFTAKKHQKEYYIYMEDVKETSEMIYVTARIVLKKKTLLNWIDIFECKTEEAKALCQKN